MTGSLFVKNSGGLAIGVGDSRYHSIKVDGVQQCLKTQQGGLDIDFRIRVGNPNTECFVHRQHPPKIWIF